MLRCNNQTNLEMEIVRRALRRVLVIEDDAETAQQIVDFLTARGCPEVTIPPGELIYIEISFFGFSASRNSSCATTSVAMSSLIGPVMKMMRSFKSRE